MTISGRERRRQARVKRELKVEIKTGTQVMQLYSIDLSAGGIKIGGASLKLTPGEQIELVIEKSGEKFTVRGQVMRDDGIHHINRIGRDGNAYFVRILDERFAEFVKTILL
jgi:c-di-GMP-binding flagellar brake protein YcgR